MSREAFGKWWLNSVFQHIGVEDNRFASDVWQAACDYQRESDARLFDGFSFGVYTHPSQTIRANKGD